MPKSYTEEELELLTEDERAGLEDEDEGTDTDAEDDGDEEGQEQDREQETDEDDGAEEDDDGEQKPGDEAEGRDDGGEEEEQPQERQQITPLIKSDPIDQEAIDAKLADIDKREDDITTKFDDGDLTTSEYRAELRKLEKERGEIDWQVKKHELSQETARQQAEANWYNEATAFINDHPEIKASQLKYGAFDTVVRQVTADPKNHSMTDRAQLEAAYKIWAEQLGITTEAKPATKQEGKKAKASKELPPTLGKVPASDVESVDDGKYGQLHRLFNSSNYNDVAKAEDMLAAMSEAEQDRFLASNQ